MGVALGGREDAGPLLWGLLQEPGGRAGDQPPGCLSRLHLVQQVREGLRRHGEELSHMGERPHLGRGVRGDVENQAGQDAARLFVPEGLLTLAGPGQDKHVRQESRVVYGLRTRRVDQIERVVGGLALDHAERVERVHGVPERLPPGRRHRVVLAFGVRDEHRARIIEQVGDHRAHAFASAGRRDGEDMPLPGEAQEPPPVSPQQEPLLAAQRFPIAPVRRPVRVGGPRPPRASPQRRDRQ